MHNSFCWLHGTVVERRSWRKVMAAYRQVDGLKVTCGLTACTTGSSLGPTLGKEYGRTLPLPLPIPIVAWWLVADGQTVYGFTMSLNVSPSMSTSFHVIVFHVLEDGETVADTTNVDVLDCFDNEVWHIVVKMFFYVLFSIKTCVFLLFLLRNVFYLKHFVLCRMLIVNRIQYYSLQ